MGRVRRLVEIIIWLAVIAALVELLPPGVA
jgi:hypothetical protein